MKRGTVFHLKGRGNEMARRTPTDLYVKIERPESSANAFQRINEFDLVYVHKISLADVLRCCPINLTTFDGRKLLIPISGINPGYSMKVEGEGMPIYEGLDLDGQQTQSKGNLYIKFNVSFPKLLTTEQKNAVAGI